MRTAITGGCGFIGKALVKHILAHSQESDDIFVIDSLSRHGKNPEIKELLSQKRISFLEGDITEKRFADKLPENIDRLYHLAAVVGVGCVEKDPLYTLKANTIGSLNIFESFLKKKNKGARLLFASTSEVYSGAEMAGCPLPVPTSENIPAVISDLKNPRFSYAVSKIWGEAYLNYLSSREDVFPVIVRYHNIYGPSMGFDHVIPQIIKRLHNKENPFRIIAGDQTRSFCFIEDAAKATYLVMESKNIAPGSTVHIGNEKGEIPIKDLYKMIFDIYGSTPENIEILPAPEGSVRRRCPETGLLFKLTGFTPATDLKEGLRITVEEYKKYYEQSLHS
ncbi:MAG: NAD(P)-dependent oxidoreductase [Candidatus Aureabacteria bacterium]|nr:NAD(P)-dependent oxidoreductase [Candidatus Auribacterota bacterium]